jgi:hypothetical protein
MKKNTISNNNILGKSLLAVVVGAGLTFSAASAEIVIDAVDTTEVNPFTGATLGSGVTVTGSNLRIAEGTEFLDSTVAPWNGNLFTYRNIDTSAGVLIYEAATDDYFQGFDVGIIVNRGQIGESTANALARFTFEGSTDGVNFSPIEVTGTFIDLVAATGNNAYADWRRYRVVPTSALTTEFTHLKIEITQKASDGAAWHQHLGSVSLDVVASGPGETAPPEVISITKSESIVTVQFSGTDGKTYELNKSTDLDFSVPDIKDSVTLSGTTTGTLEDTSATESAAFYRVEEQ